MIRQFADNKSIVVLLLPLFVIIHLLLGNYFPAFQNQLIEQENLWQLNFNLLSPFISNILVFIFICGNGLLLNYTFNTSEYYDRLNFLPSFFYILLLFLFPISFHFCEDLVAHTFFILAFNQLLHIQQNEDARNNSFLAGLFIGAAATFLPEYIFLVVLIYFTLFTIRPFVLRENILCLLGFAFPFLWVVLLHPTFYDNFLNISSLLGYTPSEKLELTLAAILTLLLFFVSYKNIFENQSKSSIRHKKIMRITMFSIVFSVAIILLLFLFFKTYFYFTILLVILPFILPFSYLNDKPKWLPEVLIYLIIAINILKFFY